MLLGPYSWNHCQVKCHEPFPCVFFQDFYSCSSYSYVFNPFLILLFCSWYKMRVQLYSFICDYPVFSAPFVDEPIIFLLSCLITLIKDFLGNINKDLFLDCSILLGYLSSFLTHSSNCYNFVICFEISKCEPSTFVLFQNSLVIWSPLRFHKNFKKNLFISEKNAGGILIRIVLKLDHFWYYVHINNSKSSNQWTWICVFSFICDFFNFFHQCFIVFSI